MVASPAPSGIYVVSSVLIVVSSACVALRYKARRLRAAKWSVDDWLILSTLVSVLEFPVRRIENSLSPAVSMGLGHYPHIW